MVDRVYSDLSTMSKINIVSTVYLQLTNSLTAFDHQKLNYEEMSFCIQAILSNLRLRYISFLRVFYHFVLANSTKGRAE